MNRRKKGILKVVLYSILLVSYILAFIPVYNLATILGIGHYRGEKDYNIDINGNSCGLNVEIYAIHDRGSYHIFGYTLTAFSSGDVDLVGISYLSYSFGTDRASKQVLNTNLNPPRAYYSYVSRTELYANDNLSIKGYTDIIFTVNNINETHKISINFGIIIPFNGGEITYYWGNLFVWVEVIYLCFTIVPVILLYRTARNFRFERWYDQEMKSRDDNFFKILSKKKKHED